MPHITLNSTEPGIRGLLEYRPETGRPLTELAEVLLRGPRPSCLAAWRWWSRSAPTPLTHRYRPS
jgi:hypothetical protein